MRSEVLLSFIVPFIRGLLVSSVFLTQVVAQELSPQEQDSLGPKFGAKIEKKITVRQTDDIYIVPSEELKKLKRDQKRIAFQVEMARTERERLRGLMHRKELKENGGMLFDFLQEREVYMWMQNTSLELDMIFISPDGRIARIHEGAVPYSTDFIASGVPVRGVLEVLAGTVKKHNFKVGDCIVSSIFSGHQKPCWEV
jgi:uncharacterized protein